MCGTFTAVVCRVLCFDPMTLCCEINCVTMFKCYLSFFIVDENLAQMNALRNSSHNTVHILCNNNVCVIVSLEDNSMLIIFMYSFISCHSNKKKHNSKVL